MKDPSKQVRESYRNRPRKRQDSPQTDKLPQIQWTRRDLVPTAAALPPSRSLLPPLRTMKKDFLPPTQMARVTAYPANEWPFYTAKGVPWEWWLSRTKSLTTTTVSCGRASIGGLRLLQLGLIPPFLNPLGTPLMKV